MSHPRRLKLLILDIDGTVSQTRSGMVRRVSPSDWRLLPGRREKVRKLMSEGVNVAIATNQAGVGFGFYTEAAMRLEIGRTVASLAGEYAESVLVNIAFAHPDADIYTYRLDDGRRKPDPGMILEAMQHFDASPLDTLMVGDRSDDEWAARAAGVHFQWAHEFFGDLEEPEVGFTLTS